MPSYPDFCQVQLLQTLFYSGSKIYNLTVSSSLTENSPSCSNRKHNRINFALAVDCAGCAEAFDFLPKLSPITDTENAVPSDPYRDVQPRPVTPLIADPAPVAPIKHPFLIRSIPTCHYHFHHIFSIKVNESSSQVLVPIGFTMLQYTRDPQT